jgi:hypothetical protein
MDLAKVTPATEMRGQNDRETAELNDLLREARQFLEAFGWCGGILNAYLGIGIPGVVGVFLFRIVPIGERVDEWVWCVVGDLPPAYISVDDAPNPAAALDSYVGAMEQWVEAAKAGASVAHLIPVNAPADPEYAQRLELRLRLLDQEVLGPLRDDLNQ